MDDIKLMITLAGKQRLPHLEADIFANHDLTCFYLNTLCKDEQWYSAAIETPYSCAWTAYLYARHIIKGRWVEAEAVIDIHHRRAYNISFPRLPK